METEVFNKNLSLKDFTDSFGCASSDFSKGCRELISQNNFRYRVLEGEECDQVLLAVLKKIKMDRQNVGNKQRIKVWRDGWLENFRAFQKSGYDFKALIPKFVRPGRVMRLNRQYVMPADPNFEWNYFRILRQWLFEKYLKNSETIYEFGSGTGVNLIALAELYPEKELHGLDFVPAPKKILEVIRKVYQWNITGHLFDMRSPDRSLRLKPNSVVFTFGSIEQLAGEVMSFLRFLIRNKPALCISVEPIFELYDKKNLLDFMAIKFHAKRGYTDNYLSSLMDLKKRGKIKILKVKRLFFGSTFMDGYSCVVWQPTKPGASHGLRIKK